MRRHEQSLSGQRGQASTTRGFELEELRQDRDREREYAIAGTEYDAARNREFAFWRQSGTWIRGLSAMQSSRT